MNETIFCGKCGTKNPVSSNFCYKCGSQLFLNTGAEIKTKALPSPVTDYEDIKQGLQNLIRSSGFIVISIGDFYVQFADDFKNSRILFEASAGNSKKGNPNIENEFEKLGFRKEPDSNYFKYISLDEFNINAIANEIKVIFESVFAITFASYNLESEFETKPPTQQVKTKRAKKDTRGISNNKGCLSILIGVLFVGIYFANNDEEGTTKANAKEVVVNSEFDGSVTQVENYLKNEYLKDPDSYQSIDWSTVQKVDNNSNCKFIVRHKYRAKNGFGGYNVEEQVFFLDSTGKVVDMQEF